MTTSYEPQLQPVAIDELRPTQMTVGFREVANKRLQWRAHASKNGPEFLGRHMVPVVIGPKQRPYLIDNHHLARALQEEGVVHVLTSIVFDLSHLEKREFWTVMDHRRWMYPFDAKGERRSWRDLPKAVADLTDDAYRSLAGAVRRAGGFAKDTTPFSEFMWADFLRTRVDAKRVDEDFERATQDALKLAHGAGAKFLPGWCGIAD
ncbi:ParB-like protein [Neorhizobium alkalisoli]|uniref:Chromosome partitioning protein ParB n=1 Tax=Neorhizobium alkalisoli TaxID=528178 RepID=A0A561QAJ9_9HYPH|nr:ParB-like protein [Neorhizobium alkalisoli]TWF47388.1 hypothetical protein FHW37_11226 [Neorhizobium alkalisoli]